MKKDSDVGLPRRFDINDLELKPPDNEKLLLMLEDKNNYVVHYRN